MTQSSFTLAFFEMDRAYGGPEEGGWWFDCGQRVRTFRTYPTRATAEAAQRRANALLHHLQRGKRDVGSVIYAGGRHSVLLFEGAVPEAIPAERPHYE